MLQLTNLSFLTLSYQSEELGRNPSNLSSSYAFTSIEESGFSSMVENNRVNMREGIAGPVTSQNSSSTAMNSFDPYGDEKVQKVSPTCQKVSREVSEQQHKCYISSRFQHKRSELEIDFGIKSYKLISIPPKQEDI